MKRLRLLLAKENVSSYIDIFLNHGNILVFPWLMAHHHSFFGGYSNLAILDVLLIHKRGYNVNIGSKKRKLYFSDVNHILKKCSESPVACCESFRPTTHYYNTSDIEECKTTTHSVADKEGFEVYSDSFDELLDVNLRLEKSEKRFKIKIEEVKNAGKTGLGKLIMKFLDFTKKNIEEVFDKEQIEAVKREKQLRVEKLQIIDREIQDLVEKIDSVPPIRRLVIKENVVVSSIKRISHFRAVINKVLTFLEEHEYVLEPLHMITHLYNENSKNFFRKDNSQYNELVSDYFKRKNEKKFLNIGEIEHLCNKYYLTERVAFYNEKYEEFNELRQKCLEMRDRGETPPKNEFISLRDIKDKLLKEVEPLIESYNNIDKSFENEEIFKLPKNMKVIINFLNNKNYEYDDFWSIIRRGETDNKMLIEGLESLREKIDNDEVYAKPDDDLELNKMIDEICENVRNKLIEDLNDRCEIDEDYIRKKGEEIKDIRKEYVNKLDCKMLDFKKLHLSEYEEMELELAIQYLMSEEQTHCFNVKNVANKTTSLSVCQQNRSIFYRRHNVPIDMPEEEWCKEVYKIEEPGMLSQIKLYEKYIDTFENICGVSPYGIIIGSFDVEQKEHAKKEKGDCSFHLRDEWANKDMFNNAIDIVTKHSRGILPIESIGMDYLSATERGILKDLNHMSRVKLNKLKKEIELKQKEKDRIMTKGGLESLYDIVNSREEQSGQVVSKSGIKIVNPDSNPIEKHYNRKLNRRKRSDEMFRKIVTDFAVKSNNIYEELEVEEAITDSNEVIEKLFDHEDIPYYLSDFKRMRLFRMEKNRMRIEAEEEGVTGFDIIRKHNQFNIDYSSNNNKKYDVSEVVSYIKILLAFKLLKMNVNASIYKVFGLKKCQSNYIKRSFVILAQSILKTFSYKV